MHIAAIVKLRCPRCLTGRVFNGIFRMHTQCPDCHLVFEREPGYFVGAMYISYALALLAVLPVYLVMTFMHIAFATIIITLVLQLMVLSPLLFRYSRVLWLHIDQLVDPR
jgi:uncharacterized protein (DUF983 family)